MSNNKTATIRKISTILMLIIVLILAVSIILMKFDLYIFEIEEIHETLGIIFIFLIIIHAVIFRKNLKNFISSSPSKKDNLS